jgi:hypothetical protein
MPVSASTISLSRLRLRTGHIDSTARLRCCLLIETGLTLSSLAEFISAKRLEFGLNRTAGAIGIISAPGYSVGSRRGVNGGETRGYCWHTLLNDPLLPQTNRVSPSTLYPHPIPPYTRPHRQLITLYTGRGRTVPKNCVRQRYSFWFWYAPRTHFISS